MAMLFTENAANSSLQSRRKAPLGPLGVGTGLRAQC
jgi:hypothetical protein